MEYLVGALIVITFIIVCLVIAAIVLDQIGTIVEAKQPDISGTIRVVLSDGEKPIMLLELERDVEEFLNKKEATFEVKVEEFKPQE